MHDVVDSGETGALPLYDGTDAPQPDADEYAPAELPEGYAPAELAPQPEDEEYAPAELEP